MWSAFIRIIPTRRRPIRSFIIITTINTPFIVIIIPSIVTSIYIGPSALLILSLLTRLLVFAEQIHRWLSLPRVFGRLRRLYILRSWSIILLRLSRLIIRRRRRKRAALRHSARSILSLAIISMPLMLLRMLLMLTVLFTAHSLKLMIRIRPMLVVRRHRGLVRSVVLSMRPIMLAM
jgi:hypothetical protein